jgi:hypothetical protein
MKVYELTSFNIENQFFNEKRFFSNMKAAKEQYELLKNYLIYNHDLNPESIEYWGGEKQILDGKFIICITTHDVVKSASGY